MVDFSKDMFDILVDLKLLLKEELPQSGSAETEAAEAILDKACYYYEEGDTSGTYANMAKLLFQHAEQNLNNL